MTTSAAFFPGGLPGSPATINITSTPSLVTLPYGTKVTPSAACTVAYTSAGASTGPSVNATFAWPGPMGGPAQGNVSLWVATSDAATLSYTPQN
jgi:hypothetical protein